MNRFKTLLLLLFPLFYIIYVISLRLNIKADRFLNASVTLWEVCFCVFMIVICIFRLYLLLKNPNEPSKYALIIWFRVQLKIIDESVNALWSHFWHTVLYFIYQINFVILWFLRKLYLWTNHFKWFICIFDIIPRISVLTGFLIDVFVFQCLHYFYWLLPLLILPLLFNVIYYILLDFHILNINDLKANLIMTYDEKTDEISAKFIPNYIPTSYIVGIVDYFDNHYIPVKFIPDLLHTYTKEKDSLHLTYINIIIAILYLVGWSSILFIYML